VRSLGIPALQGGEVQPESSTDFFILWNDITFTFQKDEKGNISKLIVHAFGHSFEVKKTS
jgi:hypothetical protein